MLNVKINFIQREQIVEKFKAGTTAQMLADEYDCGTRHIYRILHNSGVALPTREFNGDLADTLRREYESGDTTTVLGKRYNISREKVTRYIREAGGTIRPRHPSKNA